MVVFTVSCIFHDYHLHLKVDSKAWALRRPPSGKQDEEQARQRYMSKQSAIYGVNLQINLLPVEINGPSLYRPIYDPLSYLFNG